MKVLHISFYFQASKLVLTLHSMAVQLRHTGVSRSAEAPLAPSSAATAASSPRPQPRRRPLFSAAPASSRQGAAPARSCGRWEPFVTSSPSLPHPFLSLQRPPRGRQRGLLIQTPPLSPSHPARTPIPSRPPRTPALTARIGAIVTQPQAAQSSTNSGAGRSAHADARAAAPEPTSRGVSQATGRGGPEGQSGFRSGFPRHRLQKLASRVHPQVGNLGDAATVSPQRTL